MQSGQRQHGEPRLLLADYYFVPPVRTLTLLDEFDLVNDHTGLMGMAVGGALRTPVAHTVHGPLDGAPGLLYERASAVAPDVGLISISLNQRRPQPGLNWIANCPNALDFDHSPFAPHRSDYLVFLGRMSQTPAASEPAEVLQLWANTQHRRERRQCVM